MILSNPSAFDLRATTQCLCGFRDSNELSRELSKVCLSAASTLENGRDEVSKSHQPVTLEHPDVKAPQ